MGSLYGPGLGRGCWLAIVVTIAAIAAGALVVFRLSLPGSSGSSDLSPMAARYQQVAEVTLHRCDPTGDSAAYAQCIAGFGNAVRAVNFPASAKSDVDTVHAQVKLAAGCVAKTSHDNPDLREWDVGCPQEDGGTADPVAAAARDITALARLHRGLLESDAALHRDLGGSTP